MKSMMNNSVGSLIGVIETVPAFSYSVYGENMYEFQLRVERLSGTNDRIPVILSDRIQNLDETCLGKMIEIDGQIRSWNVTENGRHRHRVMFFVKKYEEIPEEVVLLHDNWMKLDGFLCKPPIYRLTPYGREVTDLMLAVNRAYKKTDYIPCIVWGRNARWAEKLEPGTKIEVEGRFQSREYLKHISEEETETRTAYELSVSRIRVMDETDTFTKQQRMNANHLDSESVR